MKSYGGRQGVKVNREITVTCSQKQEEVYEKTCRRIDFGIQFIKNTSKDHDKIGELYLNGRVSM